MSDEKSTSKGWHAAVALIRFSSILFFLTMLGHAWGYPWRATTQDPREAELVQSMRDTAFVFLGEHSTYWNLYFGWGLWVAVSLLAGAGVLWVLSDLARVGSRSVAAIAGVFGATSFLFAALSIRFFFKPPFLTLLLAGIMLLIAAVQLLRRSDR